MLSISFHRQFLIDLVSTGDGQLPNRVLKKLFSENGEFRPDRDDHHYEGIENGWIRVVSRGNTAFRVIYIRNRDGITLYRAGPHSVEDRLQCPAENPTFPVVSQSVIEEAMRPLGSTSSAQQVAHFKGTIEQTQASRFMKNHERRLLHEQLIGRRLLPHKEAILVSPYLSFDLLRSTQRLGQMLDEWVADGCAVTLITKPPEACEMSEFSQLESRGFSVMHVQKLHAKAYVFKLDREKLNRYEAHGKHDLFILGSANLTNSGFNPIGERAASPQLELSYQVAEEDHEELEHFLNFLAAIGVNHDVVRHNLANAGGTR